MSDSTQKLLVTKRLAASFLLSFGLVSGTAAQTTTDEAPFNITCDTIRAKLDGSILGTKIPGATAAVRFTDGHVCTAATGVSDAATGRKLTSTDPIFAGSIGKTFVSAFALQLVDEGRLALDEKIEHWLAKKPWFAHLPNARDITVRMLMNHSSGIPNHVEEKGFFSAATKGAEHDIAFDDLLTFILDKKPKFAAGKGYSYADTNYILLAMIEEQITGRTMYDEVGDRFLKPLKLDHTSPSSKNVDPFVHGVYENRPVVKKGRLIINPQWEWAGGGFYSTPEDLVRWAKELYSGKVLKTASLDALLHNTVTSDEGTFGLGVEVQNTEWGIAYGHNGEWPGYLSVMRYYQKYNVAVAIQINADGTKEAESYVNRISDELASLVIEAISPNTLVPGEQTQFEAIAVAWLKLIDAGKLNESWDSLSPELKAKYTRSVWPTTLKPVTVAAGKMRSRRLDHVARIDDKNVTVDFESSFTKVPRASETVILKRDTDGTWRIGSYTIR